MKKYCANKFLCSRTWLLSLLLVVNALFSIQGYSKAIKKPNDITGLWIEAKKQKVAVWVEKCQTQLCGRIYWLKKPLTKAGKPKIDSKNPELALRNRPQCGMPILMGFSASKKENIWDGGEIYDPKSGKTYKSKIYLTKDGSIKIRGYVGIPLFGKTVKWQRPQEYIQPCDQQLFATK
jgi:uncharacterized protein (DUF2147 family)